MVTSKKSSFKIAKDKPIAEVRQNEGSVGTQFRKESMPSPTNPPLPRSERSPTPSSMARQEFPQDLNSHIPISRTIFAKTSFRDFEVSPRIGTPNSRVSTERQTVPKTMIQKKSISFEAPKYMVIPTFRRGTLTSANTEKTSTKDWKKISSFNVLKNNISSENTKKNNSILVGSKMATPNQTPRSSMKDVSRKNQQIMKGFTTNSNNSDTRSAIKFKVIDPRAGMNNSSDRNNNQVDEGEPDPAETSEGADEEEGGTEGAGTEGTDAEGASEAVTEITEQSEPVDKEEDKGKEETEVEKSKAEEAAVEKTKDEESAVEKSESKKSESKKSEPKKSESKKSEPKKSTSKKSEPVSGTPNAEGIELEPELDDGDKAKKSSSQVKKPSIKESQKDVAPVKSKSKTSKKESAVEVENKNFINLIEGLKIASIDSDGHFIQINNVSDKPIDIQSRILIQRFDDAPYAVYKFPSEAVMVPTGGHAIVWANGAPEKDDKTLHNFIFPNQEFWACDGDITKTILTDMNDEALSYLTSKNVPQNCKPGDKAQEGGAGKGKGKKSETDFAPVGGNCGCDSVDSLIVTDKSLLTTKYGKDKSGTQKKTRVCELKTFDLSSLCDDFDKRDKDGLKGCTLCSCFTKKPVRQIEICCDDDGDSLGGGETDLTGTDPVDACQKICKRMAKKRDKDDELLEDDAESNRSVKAWGKPDVDYNRGKETEKSQKRKTGGKYDLNDDFCDEYGEKSKYEKAVADDDGKMTAEECETPGNNFDKFNKFMKDMCDEFGLDIMKKKDENTESQRVGETDSCNNLCSRNKIGGDGKVRTGGTDSCNNICSRNKTGGDGKVGTGGKGGGGEGGGRKGLDGSCTNVCTNKSKGGERMEEATSSYKLSQPVQDNQAIKDLCESIKGYTKTSTGITEKTEASNAYKGNNERDYDKDSCRGVCSRKAKSYRAEEDSGSDYMGNSKAKNYRDSDNDSYCGMANKGEKYSDSDDHYAGKKWGGKKDSCTNLCSRNESSYEGGDSSYSKDYGRPERSCDCTSYQKRSSMNDQSFIKQFCLELDKDKAHDVDDCSKYFFCGSCNRNYSNKLRGEPEPMTEIVKKSKKNCNEICEDFLPATKIQDLEKLYAEKEIKIVDNDCKRCMGDRWKCEDPVLDSIVKFLEQDENLSCEKMLEWNYMEKKPKKTAEQMCAESIKRREDSMRKQEEEKKKREQLREMLMQRRQDFAKKVESAKLDDDDNKHRIKKSFFGGKDDDDDDGDDGECNQGDMCKLLDKLKEIREVQDVCASDIDDDDDKSSCSTVDIAPVCDPLVDADVLMSDNFDECLNYKVSKPSKRFTKKKRAGNKNKNHCNGRLEYDEGNSDNDHQSLISSGWNGMLGSLRSYFH